MALIDAMHSFEKGMEEAAEIILAHRPDYIISPMMGSVPFIDCMHIVNEDFVPGLTHYMPASSSIEDINAVMKDWMANFLDEKLDLHEPLSLIGIDEVVSGQSAVRVYRAVSAAINKKQKLVVSQLLTGFDHNNQDSFEQAAEDFNTVTDAQHYSFISNLVSEVRQGSLDQDKLARFKEELVAKAKQYAEQLITYHSIGIEDSKMERPGKKRAKEYLKIKEGGGIIPVSVDTIVTMDKPELCPPRYRSSNGDGYLKHDPVVVDFKVTPEYVAFLSNFATISGKPAENVNPINLRRMLESSKFLSAKYQN